MHTPVHLLLPFTHGINVRALDYAVQLAKQQRAILVPLALVPTRPNQKARPELFQQAQDFLELARCKAERQGVPVRPTRVSTGHVALSIETMAGELACETVLVFLSNRDDVLLGRAEICALLNRSSCSLRVILFPQKSQPIGRFLRAHFSRYSEHDQYEAQLAALLEAQVEGSLPLARPPEQIGDSR